MDTLIENVMSGYYIEHPKGVELLKIDIDKMLLVREEEVSDLKHQIHILHHDLLYFETNTTLPAVKQSN